MNNQKTVLAVDVGFGNTKAVWGAECTPQSEILFRSIVKRTMQDPAMFGDLGAGINRVGISIDGMYFLVGPDAYLAGGEPTIDPNFVTRVEYLALLRGSMYYMVQSMGRASDIDCLVVGLPVGNFMAHKAALSKVCTGLHLLPTPPQLVEHYGPTIEIKVKSVLVLPQPLGALRHAFTIQGGSIKTKSNDFNVIIDPGYNTFDWVVTKGGDMDFERSGSFDGGVSLLLQQVSTQAMRELGTGAIGMIDCETALETGSLVANGQRYPFSKYVSHADGVAQVTVDRFMNASKLNGAITRIILTGGGAKYYQRALQERFKGYPVVVSEESVMSNARGFYLWANGAMP